MQGGMMGMGPASMIGGGMGGGSMMSVVGGNMAGGGMQGGMMSMGGGGNGGGMANPFGSAARPGGMQGGMMSMGGGNGGGMSNPFASAPAAPGFGVTPIPKGLGGGNNAPALGPKPGGAAAAQVLWGVSFLSFCNLLGLDTDASAGLLTAAEHGSAGFRSRRPSRRHDDLCEGKDVTGTNVCSLAHSLWPSALNLNQVY